MRNYPAKCMHCTNPNKHINAQDPDVHQLTQQRLGISLKHVIFFKIMECNFKNKTQTT